MDSSSNTYISNDHHDDINNDENVEFLDESIYSNDDDHDENAQEMCDSQLDATYDTDDPLKNAKKVSKSKPEQKKSTGKNKNKKSPANSSNEMKQCEMCLENFSNRSNLLRHIKTQHSDERKMYQCHLCELQVTTFSGLKMHINCRHLNLRKYKCECCSKAFNHKKYLISHLLRHSDKSRPFVCEKCGHSFFDQRTLHVRIFCLYFIAKEKKKKKELLHFITI